jgi:hypothetical protein
MTMTPISRAAHAIRRDTVPAGTSVAVNQTFEQAALAWLQKGISRNREPFRPRTAKTYRSQIETHLIPAFGKTPAHLVGNNEVAGLVKTMVGKFAPATIDLNVNVVKQIRKSLRDKDGNKLPPYLWDAEIIDAPILDKKLQKRPIPSAQAVQDALKCGCKYQRLCGLFWQEPGSVLTRRWH